MLKRLSRAVGAAIAVTLAMALGVGTALAAPGPVPMQTFQKPTFDFPTSSITLPDVDGITWTIQMIEPTPAGEVVAYESGIHAFDVTASQGQRYSVVATRASDGQTQETTGWLPLILEPTAPDFRESDEFVRAPSHAGTKWYAMLPDGTEQELKALTWTNLSDVEGDFTIEVRPGDSSGKRVWLVGQTSWTHNWNADDFPEPAFNDVEGTVELPAKPGFTWTINDEPYEPGTHAFEVPERGGLPMTVVSARAADGATDSTLHTLPEVYEAPAPAFSQADRRVSVTPRWGMEWYLVTDDTDTKLAYGGQVVDVEGDFTIEVRSNSGGKQLLLVGQTSWDYNWSANVFPEPTFNYRDGSITFPEKDGYTWTLQPMKGNEYAGDKISYAPGPRDIAVPERGQRYEVVATRTSDGQTQAWRDWLPEVYTSPAPTFDNGELKVYTPGRWGTTWYAILANGEERKLNSNSWSLMFDQQGQPVTFEIRSNSNGQQLLLAGDTSWTHTWPARPDYDLSGGDEFNDEGISAQWIVSERDTPAKGKSVYKADNLTIGEEDGESVLKIRSRRHCVASLDEPLTDANGIPDGATGQATICPPGTVTTYSTGHMITEFIYDAPQRVEIRAKMPKPHVGQTLALWMHNDNKFCNSNADSPNADIGELDVLEVWDVDNTVASTHMACTDGKLRSFSVGTNAELREEWHTWAVEYDGYAIRYYFDGEQLGDRNNPAGGPIDVTAQRMGISQERFNRVMEDYAWRFIAGIHMPKDGGWAPWAPDDRPFPTQYDLIDYIRITPYDPANCAPTGPIGQEYAANPQLGEPLGCAQDAGVAGARMQRFENGTIYWSQATGAHAVVGRILDKYLASGGPAALGLPVDGELTGLRDGGASQRFQKVTMFWSLKTGAHWARGDILAKYAANGWETGSFGYPITDEICGIRNNGCYQKFQYGNTHVYWSPATGAHFIRGRIFDKYTENRWENGDFGYPTTDEICGIRNNGCYQKFQNGNTHVYWTPATDAHFIRGRIFDRYTQLGWENGAFGYPTTDEICGIRGGGCYQRFQHSNGHIYWHVTTGAWDVRGLIFNHYATLRWENGRLGYPTGPEQCRTLTGGTRECTQRYQHGTITWNSRTGTRS
ncbi:family 16 glycosylhydrolase [Parenemella sanctibonifatiensis]|uniref:GH16 domain-containing protein n=1 Tax=Parenemella sanctibonifatiensis TaxID=2016505 RepID=A0A255EBR0_9ACTN|nr:family 16 glycosylhydrolase [Parenemella sanctibonifatiensis]OYN88976.1 hypothetical protein CGZ91_11910 [Parenemella sanctibonifatiensis]